MARAGAWRPGLGAWIDGGGVRFRVWAPDRRAVDVLLTSGDGSTTAHALAREDDGTFGGLVPGARAGDLYQYRLDGQDSRPDPASRFQPRGVHGPSEMIDPQAYEWSDCGWRGIALEDLILYEIHVGTFTAAGTYAAATERLDTLRDLGVTAIELMPLADFPGERNWGYDGVALFAPARCYGRPDDLRRLIDTAHQLGLAVFLDVVYNHLGPDGNYLGQFSSAYFSKRHRTPWGAAMNLDGDGSDMVRSFFIENALHWTHEYRIDGLRLDATHALIDDGPRHFLAELAARVHDATGALVIAEDHRNLAQMVRPQASGGWGLDGVWADDFHHQVRRGLAGDREAYYRDFTGSTSDLATTLRKGWFFCGQHSLHLDEARGTEPNDLAPRQLVICLQNHDQVGNRALGERLHHQIDAAAFRAATVLLLCAPETPLLFMGQEWAASTPFLFFTDHNSELGKLVTRGRRREFAAFAAFSDPQVREHIPDPQDPATFAASRLIWEEAAHGVHAATRRLYQALHRLRRSNPALRRAEWDGFEVAAAGDDALALRRGGGDSRLLVLVRWRGSGEVDPGELGRGSPGLWEPLLCTEDPEFSLDPTPPDLDLTAAVPRARFARPGALILKERRK